jgi:tetratricopeptide (TPR) repeat protein
MRIFNRGIRIIGVFLLVMLISSCQSAMESNVTSEVDGKTVPEEIKDTVEESVEESEASQTTEKAVELLAAQDYSKAIEQLNMLNTDLPLLHLYYAEAYFGLGDVDLALEHIRLSIDDESHNISEEYRVYGDILSVLEDYENLQAQYEMAISLDENNGLAWYGLALEYNRLGNSVKYVSSLEEAAKKVSNLKVYHALLEVYDEAGNNLA